MTDVSVLSARDLHKSYREGELAVDVLRGAQLAIDEANAKGGVLGRKLSLEVLDDQGRAEEAGNAVARRWPRIKPELRSWGARPPRASLAAPRGQLLTRDTATNAWNLSVRPGFPRGREKLHPGRARSLF